MTLARVPAILGPALLVGRVMTQKVVLVPVRLDYRAMPLCSMFIQLPNQEVELMHNVFGLGFNVVRIFAAKLLRILLFLNPLGIQINCFESGEAVIKLRL